MTQIRRMLAAFVALGFVMIMATPSRAAEKIKTHHIVFQIDQNSPPLMNLVLNNVSNLLAYYDSKGEQAEIEIVAYGPGLTMLRADKSPVKNRLKRIKDGSFPATVIYSACHNTMMRMEKKEGHPIPIVPEARVVPSGVVRVTQLEEQGWDYIRP